MSTLFAIALSNLAVAALLAAMAWSAGRWLRRPALTHGLWLLVFLKLLTPPLIGVPVIRTTAAPPKALEVAAEMPLDNERVNIAQEPVSAPTMPAVDRQNPEPKIAKVERSQPQTVDAAPVARDKPDRAQEPPRVEIAVPQLVKVAPGPEAIAEPAPTWSFDWSWLPVALCWTWLAGAALWLALASVRLVRFHRLLSQGRKAPQPLRRLAADLAEGMDVACPRLVLVPGAISPMLWVFGRKPRLVLPAGLVDRLSPEQWRTLLAHELAHWKRRDHWVRWLELATLSLYWWCPLVWWAKQQLQEAEEECCDAWVVATLPGAARDYAFALVETLDFLSGARAVLPPAASGLGQVHLLQRRLTMILRGRTPRALTLSGLAVVLMLGLLLLPLAPTWAQDQPPAGAPAAQQDDKKVDDKKTEDKDDPDKARKEFQKLQEDYIKLQRHFEDKRREMEAKLNEEFGKAQKDLMKRMREAAQKAGLQGGLGAARALPAPPAGLLIAPGQPGLPPLQPGVGPQPFPAAVGPFVAPGRPDVERRLDELERKLDRLIDRLGGGKGPSRNPGERKPQPPRGGAERAAGPGRNWRRRPDRSTGRPA